MEGEKQAEDSRRAAESARRRPGRGRQSETVFVAILTVRDSNKA